MCFCLLSVFQQRPCDHLRESGHPRAIEVLAQVGHTNFSFVYFSLRTSTRIPGRRFNLHPVETDVFTFDCLHKLKGYTHTETGNGNSIFLCLYICMYFDFRDILSQSLESVSVSVFLERVIKFN
jgi:hypothetical protein